MFFPNKKYFSKNSRCVFIFKEAIREKRNAWSLIISFLRRLGPRALELNRRIIRVVNNRLRRSGIGGRGARNGFSQTGMSGGIHGSTRSLPANFGSSNGYSRMSNHWGSSVSSWSSTMSFNTIRAKVWGLVKYTTYKVAGGVVISGGIIAMDRLVAGLSPTAGNFLMAETLEGLRNDTNEVINELNNFQNITAQMVDENDKDMEEMKEGVLSLAGSALNSTEEVLRSIGSVVDEIMVDVIKVLASNQKAITEGFEEMKKEFADGDTPDIGFIRAPENITSETPTAPTITLLPDYVGVSLVSIAGVCGSLFIALTGAKIYKIWRHRVSSRSYILDSSGC
jgi:hypothetical protein